jgi:DNA-directed RNA polymerase subunit alpha
MRIRWRGLELPTQVVVDKSISTPTYGRFLVEPFERGFGTTVGNSLRRILLSSLEGAAVTRVKISGADHEFMSIPGVLEDVSDIILNIKSLIVKLEGDGERTMRLQQAKRGEVRASDIETDPSVTIINKDQLIATLTDDVTLDIQFWVGSGRGYRTADENTTSEELGVIALDSIFSPVTRVRYRTEDTRVGQRTNYDRLILEVWTKGTVTPDMALVEAAKILRKHLNPFIQYSDLGFQTTSEGTVEARVESPVDEELQRKLNMRMSELDLSVRASNCLESAKIETVGQLVRWSEADLLKLRSFGRTSLREVKRKLADHGLTLGPPSPGSGAASGGDDGESVESASS